ncbi:MAG: helix-turn-helix domain-containing protein, partial [Candidatus Acidiferrales bacterium]
MPSLRKSKSGSLGRADTGPGSSKSLQKAMRILLHLGDHGPELSLSQLSSDLALNKSTAHRLLGAM